MLIEINQKICLKNGLKGKVISKHFGGKYVLITDDGRFYQPFSAKDIKNKILKKEPFW